MSGLVADGLRSANADVITPDIWHGRRQASRRLLSSQGAYELCVESTIIQFFAARECRRSRWRERVAWA